jgi:nucleotide-binding universal stress UspA family protein
MAEPKPAADAPQYRVTGQTYLDRLYEADDVVTFHGVPNAVLEPLNKAAEAAVDAAQKAREERQALLVVPLSTSPTPPRAVAMLPGQDVASLRKRAEDAEYKVLERDEEIVKLKAEVAALKDERDAGKVPKESGGAK